jgi:hypothetical protein
MVLRLIKLPRKFAQFGYMGGRCQTRQIAAGLTERPLRVEDMRREARAGLKLAAAIHSKYEVIERFTPAQVAYPAYHGRKIVTQVTYNVEQEIYMESLSPTSPNSSLPETVRHLIHDARIAINQKGLAVSFARNYLELTLHERKINLVTLLVGERKDLPGSDLVGKLFFSDVTHQQIKDFTRPIDPEVTALALSMKRIDANLV